MKNMILTSLLVLQGFMAFAQNADIELTPAEQLLEKDMLSSPGGVVTLSKPLRLYSYFNPATTNQGQIWPSYQNATARPNQVNSDLSHFAGAFWNLSNHTTKLVNGGPGMYLAIEPSISKSYGNSAYIIDFPAGIRYIDVSDPTWKNISKIKLSKETIPALINEGIIKKTDVKALAMHNGYFTRISMQMIAAVGNERYRNSIMRIFAKNGITMVEYTWESTKLKLICKHASTSAFVFIGDRPANMTTDGSSYPKISDAILDNTIFMSTYPVQHTSEEQAVIDLTMRLRQALDANTPNAFTPAELAQLKDVTFGCE